MDRITSEQRRRNMQAVKAKDTDIELLLRRELWSRGLRYRKNCKSVMGKPDIVFLRAKVAVFCDSEFWHGFNWNEKKNVIKSNREFWIPKIERNILRDQEVTNELESAGWVVLRFWGKKIKADCVGCADYIEQVLSDRRNEK